MVTKGIVLENCKEAVIVGAGLKGVDVGIEVKNSDVTVSGAHFDNVLKPFDIQTASKVNISGTRIFDDPKIRDDKRSSSTTQVGWTGRNGPPVPASCPKCRSVFFSRNYDVGSPRFYSRDNEETCPNCKYAHARVDDGLYDTSLEVLRIISSSDTGARSLEELNKLSVAFYSGNFGLTTYLNKVKSINPEVWRRIRGLTAAGITFINTVIMIGSYIIAVEQAELARRQTAITEQQIKQNPNEKSEKLLEEILRELSQSGLNREATKKPEIDRSRNASRGPSEAKPQKKATGQRKLKAREIRRNEARQRRQLLNPRTK